MEVEFIQKLALFVEALQKFTVDSDAKESRKRFVRLSSGVMDVARVHRCL